MAFRRAGLALLLLAAAGRAQEPQHADWIHEPARVRRAVQQLPLHRSGTVLLSEGVGASAGAGARAAKIMRELGGAEREVAKEMKGHNKELAQVEGLLHQASELSLRAGQMGASAHHSHAALLQSESKAGARAAMGVATGVAAQARALSGIAKEDAKLARSDGRLYKETMDVQATVASALKGQQQEEVLQLMGSVEAAQRKVISSELSELKETKAEVRQLQGGRAGAHAAAKAQVKIENAAQLAVQAAAHMTAYARGQVSLSREGHRLEGEMMAAKGEIAAALGKKDAEAAAQVEELMDKAAHMQNKVVRLEARDAKDAQARAKQLAAPMRAHKAALLQRSGEGASFAASLERHRSRLQSLAKKRMRVLRESKRLLSKTERAKKVALQGLEKAGAGSATLDEVAQLMNQAAGAARRVSADDRKEVALAKGELRSAAALARKLR